MSDTDILIFCAIFATVGLWRVGTSIRAVAEAVKVAMPREVNLWHKREREPWENN